MYTVVELATTHEQILLLTDAIARGHPDRGCGAGPEWNRTYTTPLSLRSVLGAFEVEVLPEKLQSSSKS